MKYIGPFLRINTLTCDNIKNQLFFLCKESLKYMVLNSRCGIPIPTKELKLKNISYNDINTIDSFSPLLCVYKKAKAKLVYEETIPYLNKDKFKKDVNIYGNAFMTLSILEMVDYYNKFKDIDNSKYIYGQLYLSLAQKQLDFYASYLRNEDGVFVDKMDETDIILEEIKFTDKNKAFNFFNQALLMSAYYKYSCMTDNKYSPEYKKFSLDILNMFLRYKNELYELSIEELIKLCLSLNIFYKYSSLEEVKSLLLDLSELIYEKYGNNIYEQSKDDLFLICLNYMNSILIYENIGILKFKEIGDNLYDKKILPRYSEETGIIIKQDEKKRISYTPEEILSYTMSILMHSSLSTNYDDDEILIDIFKNQIVNSRLILSWPLSPSLDDIERYYNYSLKAEDLIEDENFRIATAPSPDINNLAPVFSKKVTLDRKKSIFTEPKSSFDCNMNMYISFMIIFFYKYIDNSYIFDVSKKS